MGAGLCKSHLVFGSSFCGCSSSYHEPPTMGIAVALSSIAAVIPLRWWRMRARSKAHDPLRRSAWSAADRAANYAVDRPPRWRLRIFVEIRRRRVPSNAKWPPKMHWGGVFAKRFDKIKTILLALKQRPTAT